MSETPVGEDAYGRAVLVTGAAGLIGSAVVRLLRARGSRVIAVDDFSIGTWHGNAEGITWLNADVADAHFPDLLEGQSIGAVVHCAAHPGGRSLEEPCEDVRVNALGSMRVFERCARAGVPVVYLSSSAVYGEQPPVPIAETAPLHPGTVYAVCKVACENFLQVLAAGRGLQWTVLRLFATYGAGHRPSTHQGIINVMLTQLLTGDEVQVRGPLDRVRDLLYVDDAARAIVHCLFEPSTRGQVFNVGTGQPVTVHELIATLCELLGRDLRTVKIIEGEPTVGDPRYSVANIALLTATGFEPEVSLRTGLGRLVAERTQGSVAERGT